jgi:hypothetical protein
MIHIGAAKLDDEHAQREIINIDPFLRHGAGSRRVAAVFPPAFRCAKAAMALINRR